MTKSDGYRDRNDEWDRPPSKNEDQWEQSKPDEKDLRKR